MFIAVNHWSGPKPLASTNLSILDPHQDSSRISCCCYVSWRSCSFGASGLASSHAPEAHWRGKCWGGPIQIPGSWTWVVSELVIWPALRYPHHQGELPSEASWSAQAAAGQGMASPLTVMPLGQAHQCLWNQGQLYCAAQGRCKDGSPESCSQWGTGPALHSPWIFTWSQSAAQSRDVCMDFHGNMGHGHWHRPLLLNGHRPTIVLGSCTGLHHGLSWQNRLLDQAISVYPCFQFRLSWCCARGLLLLLTHCSATSSHVVVAPAKGLPHSGWASVATGRRHYFFMAKVFMVYVDLSFFPLSFVVGYIGWNQADFRWHSAPALVP